jgi:hypothetical protein
LVVPKKSPPIFTTSPPPPDTTATLTMEELAFLKKQEAAWKISLHHETLPHPTNHSTQPSSSTQPTFTFLEPHHTTELSIVYNEQYNTTYQSPPNQTPPHPDTPPHQHHPFPNHHKSQTTRETQSQFRLAIARPKLDFPSFTGEEPMNWLRLCEKYFSLANVPMELWVSLATLHCHGVARTWWRSLRTPVNYVHWNQFSTMGFNRFFAYSSHSSLE